MKNLELPHDVVIKILAQLPVKTLFMFKTVCSSWRTTIESPFFARLQASSYCRNHDSEDNVLMRDSDSFYVVDLNTLSVRKIVPGFQLPTLEARLNVYSSNGVSLFVDEHNKRMVLWNPATGNYRDIPCPPYPDRPGYVFPRFYGLWFDSSLSGNEFRIMHINNLQQLFVLDSNSNSSSWKTFHTGLPDNFEVKSAQLRSKAFIHGGFHVAAFNTPENRYRIFSFSPDGEVIRDFQPPLDWIEQNIMKPYLQDLTLTTAVWEGQLCLQAMVWDCFWISECWNMEEYGNPESWKKVLSFEKGSGYYLHSLQQNGRRLLVSTNEFEDRVCVTDGDSNEMKSITPSSESLSFVGTYTYTPTLLCP